MPLPAQVRPSPSRLKSRPALWLPFGLWRVDWYYIKSYVKTFVIILVAIGALVVIGDMFQRFENFSNVAREDNLDLAGMGMLFLRYYSAFVSQLVLQYMLPLAMLLAATITATASFAGPRGNNEYVVIRSVGVPVLRAFFPLVFPAFVIALAFQAGRDNFLPAMVRQANAINARLFNRTSNPTDITMFGPHGFQAVAIGWFAPGSLAHNMILEIRDSEAFRRGRSDLGDNDFVAYRAALARLEPRPGGGHQWVPLEKGRKQVYTRFSRREDAWTEPVPTDFTPAMIERLTLGDAVSTWNDLMAMQRENTGAKFEMHWRATDPIGCALLVIFGTGFCMGRMLRGRTPSHIQSVALSMLAAGVYYVLRLTGKSLWEAKMLGPEAGAWLPIAAVALLALLVAWWME